MGSRLSEKEVQREIVDGLRSLGWVVRTFNSGYKAKSGLVGWYDVVAIKRNHVFLIEVKAQGRRDATRKSQKRLHAQVEPHTGPNVHQIVADDLVQVLEVLNGVSELWEGDK